MVNKDYTRLPTSEPASEDLEEKKKVTWQHSFRRVVTSSYIAVVTICLGVAAVVLAVSWCTRTTSTSARPCESLAVRLEWRDLNREEKREYLRAVSCLRERPSRLGLNQTLYDDFPYFHTWSGEDAHYTAAFLAWHRRFLYIYEKTLQQQCGYKGQLTYWNWNLDWENVTRAPVWDAELGFGGNGNMSDSPGFRGFCVTDGAFSRLKLPFIGPMHIPHCLSRSFPSAENLTSYAQRIRPEAMQEVFNASTYDEFSSCLEEGPHLAIPFTIRGDFSVPTAPQDPLFFLHHAQMDRLWWQWQQADPKKRLRDYSGRAVVDNVERTAKLGDTLSFGGLGTDVSASEVMNTEAWPLCYRY